MFITRSYSPLLFLGLSSICSSAVAEDAHQHEHRQHEAHVHGVVTFNIVQEDKELLMEITSPGNDVLGYEHTPQTDAEKQVYQQASALLNKPEQVFTLTDNAQCKVEHASVKSNIENETDEHHDHEAEEDHHDHDHDHDHDQHGTFTVEYHFECDNIQQLSSISTQWFTHFPSTQTIEVNLLTDTKQKHIELKNPQNTIEW
ncbi:zinc uptake protein ZrgA [Vibrio rumoiensis]|uniref:Zinc-binding protein n=1 Tax=Vibrio rumoiensis 1S-45 TaxID=1188252 RepID=A0A1E5DYV6_9VIBR|nr:DUF2796 domain-containing protein [Vibrio rumoiensis]OEF23001.1 zinc-binding protein [Vibrio rumoiensis 1S-45]